MVSASVCCGFTILSGAVFKLKILIRHLAFVLILPSIFGATINAQKGVSEVKGLLWNAACKNGIPDAQIILSDGQKKYKTRSDRSGRYLYKDVRPATYQIAIKRYGFLSIVQEQIRIVESEHRTLNFEMEPGFESDDSNQHTPNSNPCDYSAKKSSSTYVP